MMREFSLARHHLFPMGPYSTLGNFIGHLSNDAAVGVMALTM